MFEFLSMVILPVSIIFNVLLVIRGINFVKRNEQLQDLLNEYSERDIQSQEMFESMLNQMKEIDLRGSFEADDEVGAVFSELKKILEMYKSEN